MTCGQGMLSGVEEVINNPEGVKEPRDGREGSLALWPMIMPDGHAAGVKRLELGVMTSGMWRPRICHPVTMSGGGIM